MAEISEQLLIAEIERRLTSKYAQLPPDQISSAIQNAHARFEQSPIRDFVPLLVERRARAELAGAAQKEILRSAETPSRRANLRSLELLRWRVEHA
jgi:hypothetical protein